MTIAPLTVEDRQGWLSTAFGATVAERARAMIREVKDMALLLEWPRNRRAFVSAVRAVESSGQETLWRTRVLARFFDLAQHGSKGDEWDFEERDLTLLEDRAFQSFARSSPVTTSLASMSWTSSP